MAKSHGKDGIVKVATNAVGEVTEFTFTETTDIVRSDAMGDDDHEYLAGKSGATGSMSFRFDSADTNGQIVLTNGATVALKLYPTGEATGKQEITIATAIVTNVATSSSHEDVVSGSCDFTVSGAYTKANIAGGG